MPTKGGTSHNGIYLTALQRPSHLEPAWSRLLLRAAGDAGRWAGSFYVGREMKTKESLTVFALQVGLAVPVLYFGTQIIAAPFYPGYSFLTMVASVLGSERAIHPTIFNVGAILTGIATLIASLGFLLAFQRLAVNPILAWLTSIAIFLNGLGSLWAGFIPLPDPRHGANPFAVGIFTLPALLTATLWKRSDARLMKIYLVLTNLLFIALIPIMSGMAGLDTRGYQGLLQRITALVFFPPIGVGAYFLINRIKQLKAADA
jgi:hypothetical protein